LRLRDFDRFGLYSRAMQRAPIPRAGGSYVLKPHLTATARRMAEAAARGLEDRPLDVALAALVVAVGYASLSGFQDTELAGCARELWTKRRSLVPAKVGASSSTATLTVPDMLPDAVELAADRMVELAAPANLTTLELALVALAIAARFVVTSPAIGAEDLARCMYRAWSIRETLYPLEAS
jgi:hypothetical protein